MTEAVQVYLPRMTVEDFRLALIWLRDNHPTVTYRAGETSDCFYDQESLDHMIYSQEHFGSGSMGRHVRGQTMFEIHDPEVAVMFKLRWGG